jgi:hypothetical protein
LGWYFVFGLVAGREFVEEGGGVDGDTEEVRSASVADYRAFCKNATWSRLVFTLRSFKLFGMNVQDLL